MYTRETAGQFLRYAVVGLGSSSATFGVFLILYRFVGMHYLTASGIGYCVGLVGSFLMNKEWTFRVQGTVEGMLVRFALIHGVSMGINVGSLQFLTVSLGVVPELGQLSTLGCAGIFNFLGSKFWTFRPLRAESGA